MSGPQADPAGSAPGTQPPLPPKTARELLTDKLQWLMLFRVLMVTVLLGSTIVVSADSLSGLSDPFHLILYSIVIGTYALTLIYAVLLRRIQRIVPFAYAQLAGDVLISGALVFVTGGSESVFTFLFSLSIINGAILLYRNGALTVATFSSACFMAIVLTDAGILPPFFEIRLRHDRNLYYVAFIHFTTFYLVAILATYLAEQLRQAGEELEEKQLDIDKLKALNENIVNSLASGLLTVSDAGRVIFFNPGAARITGYSERDVLYRPIQEVFPELSDVLAFASSEDADSRFETLFTRRDKARVFLGYTVSQLRNHEGRVFGKIVHFQDNTEKRALESAVKRHVRLAAIGQLAAAIAHEIRNPLASISGSAQVLGSFGESSEQVQRLLDIVVRETDRLNALVTDFLDFARPKPPMLVPTELTQLVAETVDGFRLERTEGQDVVVETRWDGPVWAVADGDQIRQVLWNLLANAAQVSESGGKVLVGVDGVDAHESRPHRGRIRVEDQGPGVPAAQRSRIFEPFYTTRKGGTGLGLAVVERIVVDHGGDLEVEASPEGGAAFVIHLPGSDAAEAVA